MCPFVENLTFEFNFSTLLEVIPKPPVSWSAVTINKVFGFSSTNFKATPIALSNSMYSLVRYSRSLSCPPQSTWDPSTSKKKGLFLEFNFFKIEFSPISRSGFLP